MLSAREVSVLRDGGLNFNTDYCSDILAELNLLPSGILQYEGLLPYPNIQMMIEEMKFPAEVINSYVAQLFLRKRMNEISGRLYNPKQNLTLEARMTITADFQKNTLDNQIIWAKNYAFHEDDPPAQDILTARYRAKFWGAHVINYRPYVEDIIGWSHARKHPEEYRSKKYSSLSVPSDATTPSDIPEFVFKLAERGIKAVIKSTEAFHGLKDKRFIITNVFGTAHAYVHPALVLQDTLLTNPQTMGQPYHSRCRLSRSISGSNHRRGPLATLVQEDNRILRNRCPGLEQPGN